ncbi:MAG: UbiA family prenyltransferase [Fibrobacterales bacterium]
MADYSLKDNDKNFLIRFWIYQKERFPFFQHGILITAFAFSAAAYSRLCRDSISFIPLSTFIVGAFTAIGFFFLLRLFDEFKDYEDDARYRPYRAVPRGLISFKELKLMVLVVIGLIVIVNGIILPKMLPAIAICFVYLGLMTKEFFVPEWLKKHPMIYMASHMMIMPLIDLYTTGLDWMNEGISPPHGVEVFLIVSFFNGIVIEVGRKIRAPQDEEEGVETYSALYGTTRAALIWIAALVVTALCAVIACSLNSYSSISIIILSIVFPLTLLPAILYLKNVSTKSSKRIELAAGVWTIGMYLIVGATPLIVNQVLS